LAFAGDIAAGKVIYTRGYNNDLSRRGLTVVEGVNFLQKPCTLQKPAGTLRKSLNHK